MEQTETKQLGALLPGIIEGVPGSTVLLPPSTMPWQTLNLDTLPERLDDETLAMVTELANCQLPASQPCGDVHFVQCLKSLDILPRRQDDGDGGRLKVKLYQRHLAGFSEEAMSYLAFHATRHCDWFPTIAECFRILAAWPNRERDDQRRCRARALAQNEYQVRQEQVLELLRQRALDQDAIDDLSDHIKRIAAEKCYLHALTDGTYRIRPDFFDLAPEEAEAHRALVRQWTEEGLL